MKTIIKSNPLVSFFVLTFAFTWLFWGLTYALHLSMAAGYVPFLIGATGPSVMAFVVSALIGGKDEVRALWKRITIWRVSWVWYLAALFIPAIVVLGGIGLNVLFGGAAPDFSSLAKEWFLIPIALVTGMILGGPLEEEFGWRGFAIVRLQERHSSLTASVIVGLLWGLWHLPAFLIPWTTQHGLPMLLFLIHDIAFAVLLTWIFNNTRGSIWMVMLAHASLNLTITILPVTPSAAGSEQPLALAIGLLYLAALVVLLVSGPKTLIRVSANP